MCEKPVQEKFQGCVSACVKRIIKELKIKINKKENIGQTGGGMKRDRVSTAH